MTGFKHLFVQIQGTDLTSKQEMIEQLEKVIFELKRDEKINWRSTKDTGYWYAYDEHSNEQNLFDAPISDSVRMRLVNKLLT